VEIIKRDAAGEPDLGSASFPGSSLGLLDEPARKTGLPLRFLWRLSLYSYHSDVRCFRVNWFFFACDNPEDSVFFFKQPVRDQVRVQPWRSTSFSQSARTGSKAVWTFSLCNVVWYFQLCINVLLL